MRLKRIGNRRTHLLRQTWNAPSRLGSSETDTRADPDGGVGGTPSDAQSGASVGRAAVVSAWTQCDEDGVELSVEQAEEDLEALDEALAVVVRRFLLPPLIHAGVAAAGGALRARQGWRMGLPGDKDDALSTAAGHVPLGGEGGGRGEGRRVMARRR